MLLDFVQFVKKLESISEGLAIPDKLYAEDYIKAYYKSEDELREWIRIHKVSIKSSILGHSIYCHCRNTNQNIFLGS